MRRMFIVIPLLTLLVSCNIVPKECEQLSDMIGDIPALKKNDYNDCELVSQNYTYFAKWLVDSYMEHYPATEYFSQQGDTVTIKGFITHGYGDTLKYYNDGYWACHLTSDSLEAMDKDYHSSQLTIYSDNKDLFDYLDFTRKCYITATVQFNNPLNYESGPADPKSCFANMPIFKIMEIKN